MDDLLADVAQASLGVSKGAGYTRFFRRRRGRGIRQRRDALLPIPGHRWECQAGWRRDNLLRRVGLRGFDLGRCTTLGCDDSRKFRWLLQGPLHSAWPISFERVYDNAAARSSRSDCRPGVRGRGRRGRRRRGGRRTLSGIARPGARAVLGVQGLSSGARQNLFYLIGVGQQR
ncbi:MAG: hypothetical protein DMG25_17510, partial [Acidobacteria bacterium]